MRRDELVAFEQVGRIHAAEDRVEKPTVPLAVDLPCGRLVLGCRRVRIDVMEVQDDPDLRLGRDPRIASTAQPWLNSRWWDAATASASLVRPGAWRPHEWPIQA